MKQVRVNAGADSSHSVCRILSSQPSGASRWASFPTAASCCRQAGGSSPWERRCRWTRCRCRRLFRATASSCWCSTADIGRRPSAFLPVDGMKEIARVPVADGWLGLTFSPDGTRVYVGGGSKYAVYEFSFLAGRPVEADARHRDRLPAPSRATTILSAMWRCRRTGGRSMRRICITIRWPRSMLQSGRVDRTLQNRAADRTGFCFIPDGKSYFVSSWADGAVYLHETRTGSEITRMRLGPHTTDMVLSDRKIPATTGTSRRVELPVVCDGGEHESGIRRRA